MPKTKNAFALRDIHETIKSPLGYSEGAPLDYYLKHAIFSDCSDEAIGKWIGADIKDFQLIGAECFEYQLQSLERDLKKLKKKITRVDAHILQLKEYMERIFDRIVSGDSGARERGIRARMLQSNYSFIIAGLRNTESNVKKLIKNCRNRLPAEFKKNFSERLKQARKQKGLTVDDVAERLSLSYNGYSQYERGIREPPLWTLYQLAKILDVSADWLLGIKK